MVNYVCNACGRMYGGTCHRPMQTCNMDERTNEEKLQDTITQLRERIKELEGVLHCLLNDGKWTSGDDWVVDDALWGRAENVLKESDHNE